MSDSSENTPDESGEKKRSLREALYVVKARQADRDDVVVDMREAEQVRLELLAEELKPMFAEIDEDDDRFELALSRGERPRLWVDMTTHVSMGHDRRTYRFLKDTRMGRIVLAESGRMEDVADSVSNYVAEKVLERERILEGEWVSLKNDSADKADDSESATDTETANLVDEAAATASPTAKTSIWRSFFTFLFGVAITLLVLGIAAHYLMPEVFDLMKSLNLN